METKLKTLFICLLLAGSINTAIAQDKFDLITIFYETSYNGGASFLRVSTNGATFSEEKIKVPSPENNWLNTSALLKKVNEYQEQGWEVMNFNFVAIGTTGIHIAYLRKKKN